MSRHTRKVRALGAWLFFIGLLQGVAHSAGSALPGWLPKKEADILKAPATSPPRKIFQIRHDGKTYYFISATCCDVPAEVLSDSGEHVCFSAGGFATDLSECRDIPMHTGARVEVWRDPR